MLRTILMAGSALGLFAVGMFIEARMPVWEARSKARAKHQKFNLARLRREAMARHEILQVAFFPDLDSIRNADALFDLDRLIQVDFIPVSKTAKPK